MKIHLPTCAKLIRQIRDSITPDILKLASEKCPVEPISNSYDLFKKDCRKKMASGQLISVQPDGSYKKVNRLNFASYAEIYNNTSLDDKIKYESMAEFEKIRFRMQRALWIGEFGSALLKYGPDVERVSQCLPSAEKINKDSLMIFEKANNVKINKNIRFKSALAVIRRLRERIESGKAMSQETKNKIKREVTAYISTLPEAYVQILNQPTPPLTGFIKFYSENKDEIRRLRNELYPKSTNIQVCKILYEKLSQEELDKYSNQYREELEAYKRVKTIHDKEYPDSMLEVLGSLSDLNAHLNTKLKEYGFFPAKPCGVIGFLAEKHDVNLKKARSIWDSMSPEEKKNLVLVCNVEMEQYREVLVDLHHVQALLCDNLYPKLSSWIEPLENVGL